MFHQKEFQEESAFQPVFKDSLSEQNSMYKIFQSAKENQSIQSDSFYVWDHKLTHRSSYARPLPQLFILKLHSIEILCCRRSSSNISIWMSMRCHINAYRHVEKLKRRKWTRKIDFILLFLLLLVRSSYELEWNTNIVLDLLNPRNERWQRFFFKKIYKIITK